MKVITNNVPRPVIESWGMCFAERAEFDYVDWKQVDAGNENPQFVRFKGTLYDLGEFTADYGITRGSGLPAALRRWDGYLSDSFFSAVVVRWCDDGESVVMGTVLA